MGETFKNANIREHHWDCRPEGDNGYSLWYRAPNRIVYQRISGFFRTINDVKQFVSRRSHIRKRLAEGLGLHH